MDTAPTTKILTRRWGVGRPKTTPRPDLGPTSSLGDENRCIRHRISRRMRWWWSWAPIRPKMVEFGQNLKIGLRSPISAPRRPWRTKIGASGTEFRGECDGGGPGRQFGSNNKVRTALGPIRKVQKNIPNLPKRQENADLREKCENPYFFLGRLVWTSAKSFKKRKPCFCWQGFWYA